MIAPRILALVIVTFAVLLVACTFVAYQLGTQAGGSYQKGYNAGFGSGQTGLILQWNSYIPLSPGSVYTIDLSSDLVGYGSVSGYIDFALDCTTITFCPGGIPNGTVQLSIQSGPRQIFSTGYVQNESTHFSFTIPPPGNYRTYLTLEANPQNNASLVVFWETPLVFMNQTAT
jgi:hypothetical protein